MGRVKQKVSSVLVQTILRRRKVGICSPLKHSEESMILLADSEGSDQTARMRRVIWAINARRHFFREPWFILSLMHVRGLDIPRS